MNVILYLLIQALEIYLWLIIIGVIVSWLLVFGVLNSRNRWVHKFCTLLDRATEPVMQRLRRVIPPLGGIDLSPMVLIFGIYLIQGFLIGLMR